MKLYRYEAIRYSIVLAPVLEIFGTRGPKLELDEYPVDKETPKGYWILGKSKWVSKTSRKRFAYPTKEEALSSYKMRKESYVNHSIDQLRRAKEDLSLVDKTSNIFDITTGELP